MNAREFKRVFGPSITTLINLERATKENWKVSSKVLSKSSLGDLKVVWYKSDKTINRSPYSVAEVAREPTVLPEKRRQRIFSLTNIKSPLLIPVMKYKKISQILDGNHRVVAAYLALEEVYAIVYYLHVPGNHSWDIEMMTK